MFVAEDIYSIFMQSFFHFETAILLLSHIFHVHILHLNYEKVFKCSFISLPQVVKKKKKLCTQLFLIYYSPHRIVS